MLVMMNFPSPRPNSPSLPCASRVVRNKLLPRMTCHTVGWLGRVGTAQWSYLWGTMILLSRGSVSGLCRGKLWQWLWATSPGFQLVQPGIRNAPLHCNMQAEEKPLSRRGTCFWPLFVLFSRTSSWKGPPPVCSSGVKRSGSAMLKSQTLLWAGFFVGLFLM